MSDKAIKIKVISAFFLGNGKVAQVDEVLDAPARFAHELITNNKAVRYQEPPAPPAAPEPEVIPAKPAVKPIK